MHYLSGTADELLSQLEELQEGSFRTAEDKGKEQAAIDASKGVAILSGDI